MDALQHSPENTDVLTTLGLLFLRWDPAGLTSFDLWLAVLISCQRIGWHPNSLAAYVLLLFKLLV